MQVVVGRVGRPHGIRGQVSVEVRTDDPQRRLGPGARLLTDPPEHGPLTVLAGQVHAGRLLLQFAGVGDRTAAEALRDTLLLAEVDPDERPADPEEFYDHQLVGLAVIGPDGHPLGTVTDVLHLPGQDVLEVSRSGRPVLVPFVGAFVPEVDLAAGRLVVDPPPGLFDDDGS